MVAPARAVTHAVPLPLIAYRCGPPQIFSPDPVAAEAFDRLGTAIQATSADQFSAFAAATATMATYLPSPRRSRRG